MQIVLIGADLEENLGMGMVAAAAVAAGHQVQIVPFDEGALDQVARKVADGAPELVGLSMQFQHKAGAFLRLAALLRDARFGGHISAGGQFATAAWQRVLGPDTAVDSVVLHDGEETFVALLEALEAGRSLTGVDGLALRRQGAEPERTRQRGLIRDLDRLPFVHRYRPHVTHMGVPFIPVLGSRGCWGQCTFCSITPFYRSGSAAGGGPALRLRSPENLAAEMALLWAQAGGQAVFCLHDDTLLLPRPADSLVRLRAVRAALDSHGVGQVALVGKCRPDTLTPQLARELRALGVVRLFVGVENASQPGADHLGRNIPVQRSHEALEACRAAGIFCCYNLLIFEPRATLDDIEQNVAFIRRHAHFPINFCRAEAYTGTSLHRQLVEAGQLRGDGPGGDYQLEDDRTEVLFRICATAFRERNFARRGVHNRYMGLGYSAKLLEQFYPAQRARAELITEAEQLTCTIALETADLLEQAVAIARLGPGEAQRDRLEGETALLALRVAAADREQQARLDRLFDQMEAFAQAQQGPPARRRSRRARFARGAQQLARALAVAGLLGGGGALLKACGDDRTVVLDGGGSDIWPTDDAPSSDSWDIWPTDDAPSSDSWDIWPTDDAPSPDLDAGMDMSVDPAPDMVADPPPPPPDVMLPQDAGAPQSRLQLDEPLDRWRDSGPTRIKRSSELPLYDLPRLELQAERQGDAVAVELCCDVAPVNIRWEGDGQIEGEGQRVVWRPQCEDDQLRVGVRSAGGVAVVTLRKKEVCG